MTDQTPQTTTEPVENLSAKLTAIRDKFLIPTPDKDHTDYAVITRCIEALTTPQPLSAPAEGYVLVPVEPTEAMGEAGRKAGALIYSARANDVYRAMIAACLPAAPTGASKS